MRNNVNVQLYSSCNCDCKFCNFKDKCHSKIDPQFVLDYLGKHDEIEYIVLTGGEPTLAIDVYQEIIQGIEDENKQVVLQTNGWWGNNDYVKQALLNNPPTKVQLSVDSKKQQIIPLETVKNAYQFLCDNGIPVSVVNHTEDDAEYASYLEEFPKVYRGKICSADDGHEHNCGVALLATNEIGTLNVGGWNGNI